ncbi:MAG: aldolase [Acidobacteriia bacterium]|nr:aldolase [Terriglobia bacterium]
MRVNHTRERLDRGETVFGCGLQAYRSAEVPRAFAAAGFDYVFIDMEHGAFDLETVQDMVAASVTSGITPIVRVGELLYSLVARLLDAGAQGIILPRVEDPAILAEALSWMRFPPAGKRGYGVSGGMIDFEPRTFAEIIEHLNRNTLAVAQIETAAAVERADELLSVPGLDVVMVGPADLSISLGVPGQFGHGIPQRLRGARTGVDRVRNVLAAVQRAKADVDQYRLRAFPLKLGGQVFGLHQRHLTGRGPNQRGA